MTYVLHSIQSKYIEKVVLGRRTSLYLKDPVNPFDVLRSLKAKNSNAVCFLLQFSEELAFVGATPEKLYSRKGKTITSEALAGTFPLSETGAHLKDPKTLLEFLIVKQFIHAQLSPFCESLKWEESNRIVKTSTVQHLYNKVTAGLKPGVFDYHLIPLLHPTPAIAGSPRPAAISFLYQREPFDRGWYSSPIGWIEKDQADIAVGIRSCLIRSKEIHLFAGAGIVRESHPDKEWEELNDKVSQFME
ncbi:MAG: isochorismate synthase [Rhabdochlamydiaceae bacterium]